MSMKIVTNGVVGAAVACALILSAGGASYGQAARQPTAKALAGDVLQASGVAGGLVVHLNCGDGKLTAALGAGEAYLVHGLEADGAKVAQARAFIQDHGLYGKVAVEQWTSPDRLPYVDNLVNLIVVGDGAGVPEAEILRVLAPNGVAITTRTPRGEYVKLVKPRPKEIDEWTHYLHDASNNAVAADSVVGPPRHMQWVGSPTWTRHHDHMSGMNAMVSAGGRIFYIFDEGPTDSILLPTRWTLIARDAFNGVILWKRPFPTWHPQLYPFKSGPAYLPRRLVAVGDRVYVTLGIDAPLTCLDAVTGKTLRTYDDSKGTEDVLASEGVLFVVVNDAPRDWSSYATKTRDVRYEKTRVAEDFTWNQKNRRVMAVNAESGKLLWKKDYPVSPLSPAADAGHFYFHDGEKVVCLNRNDGSEAWQSEPVKEKLPLSTAYAPTLVVYQDVVLFSGVTKRMTALAADTGKKLWDAEHYASGHYSPEDLLVVNGLVWSGEIAEDKGSGLYKGRDVHTGEVKVEFPPDVKIYWFHHRCYRSKATEKYLIPSRAGIEFIDVAAQHWITNHWVRGSCIYGTMPCNGLIYAPQSSCACYTESKLNGLCVLAPESPSRQVSTRPSDEGRLQQGPAYDAKIDESAPNSGADWPTYRHDAARSGSTRVEVPAEVKPSWETRLGGRLTPPVVAAGRLYVASIDTHTVWALESQSGKKLWSYTAGGRVDSPPTIYQGRVLFGSNDGWVYCLRAADGALVWRFRGAPEERRMVSFEQVESVWPVHGSVLVSDGSVYFVAGRLMFIDGGLRMCQLDARTGKKLFEKVMDDRDPQTGENLQSLVKGLNMPVAKPDVLSTDGKMIYMRSQQFDLDGERKHIAQVPASQQAGEGRHLFSPTGFLDDNWFHRSYWVYGRSFNSGAQGWPRVGHQTPSGGLLAVGGDKVYGFGRKPQYYRWTTPVQYELFACDKDAKGVKATTQEMSHLPGDSMYDNAMSSAVPRDWNGEVPVLVRALTLAGKTLFIAGPPKLLDEEDAFAHQNDPQMNARLAEQAAALEGAQGGLLWAVSAADGKKVSELKLDATPVFDGMIAADGKLFVSTKAGKVICLSGK